MSTSQSSAAPQLPSPQQSVEQLFRTILAPIFFEQLAKRGHPVNSDNQAGELLKIASALRSARVHPQNKPASTDGDTYTRACQALDAALQMLNVNIASEDANRDTNIDATIKQWMANPEVYNAVLSLKSAEAAACRDNPTTVPAQSPSAYLCMPK